MRPRRKLLITGASGGIGAHVARLLAARGDDVWITYAGNAAGAETTRAACAADGAEAITSRVDLRDPAAVEQLFAEVGERWGALGGLVNNAGTCPYTDWEQIDLNEWDAVLETNARGTFLAIRHAVPLLRAADGDRAIVNVASLAGQVGAITTSVHYAASKAAVLAITRSFAKLLAPDGIRVNAVAPGPVQTAITANLTPAARSSLERAVPLRRLGEPSDVAHAIVLLASPEAAFTTGATYDVNGGLRMD